MSSIQIALAATTRIVQAILRATDEKALLDQACSIVVEVGFGFCWVGEAENDAAKTVRPLAWAGHEDGYLSKVNISWGEGDLGHGPTGTAIRTAKPVVVQEIDESSPYFVRLSEAARRGYRSYCALPLLNEGASFGVMCIYSTQVQAFGEPAMKLLVNLAEMLSFGVINLRNQKQVRETLQQREEQLRQAVRVSQLGIFDLDHSTGNIYCSPEHRKIYGLSRDEHFTFSMFLDRVHPEDLEEIKKTIQAAHDPAGDGTHQIEHRLVRPDGTTRWASARAQTFFDGAGSGRRPSHTIGAIEDITKRKQAASALRESRERLDLALQGAELGIWDWDPPTGETIYSDLWAQILGYQPGEVAPHVDFFKQHVHPDDLPGVLDCLNAHLDGRLAAYQSEHRMRTKSGGWVWVLDRGKVMERGKDGRPLRVSGVISDITQRKLTEENSRQQARIMDQIHDSVVATDMSGIITSWNGGAERLFGYSPADTIGRHVSFLYPPKEYELLQQQILKPLQMNGWCETEARAVTRYGEHIHINLMLSLMKDSSGNVTGMIGNSMDITERKLAEEKIRKSEKLLLQSQRIAHIGSWSFELETQNLTWTAETYAIYGVSPLEFTPSVETLLELVHPDDRQAMKEWIAAAASGQSAPPLEFRAIRPDGEIRTLSGQGEMLPANGAQSVVIVGTVQDITERRQAEEALRESEFRHRALIENAVYGIFVSRLAGRFDEVNPALVAMLGYDTKEELLALDPSKDVYCREEDRAAILAQIRRTKVLRGAEVGWKRKDGTVILVRLSGRIVENEKGEADRAEVMVENVTEARRIDLQLRQAQKMEAVGRLAGGVAHDFNNLLAVMLGQCEMIAADLGPQERLRKKIDVIAGAATRAADLTRQLLAFSRQQVLQPRFLDLNANVRGMASLLGRLIGEHITMETRLARELGTIKADPGQIEQVITNLVLNARDAMLHGGTLLLETANRDILEPFSEGNFTVSPGRYVTLAVSDTGIGIDENDIARIFEPFYTTKEIGKGTGLGLATVEGIVSQSGGQITVRSIPGRGSTFTVYLPHVTGAVTAEKTEMQDLVRTAQGETILLVEDEAALRAMLQSCLEKAGYTVLPAANGHEALAIANSYQGSISLLLTDVVMPGMDGAELARRLCEISPQSRVLYVSGYNDRRVLPAYSGNGDVIMLEKPFPLHALTLKIRESLSRKAPKAHGAEELLP